MEKYPCLGKPLRIGNIEVKNRFCVAPVTIGTHYRPEGGYSDTAIRYFEERAKGGFGLIITGALVADHEVDPYSVIGDSILLNPENFKEAGIRLTRKIHSYGTKIFAQITMGLGRNYPDLPAPSEMPVYDHPDKLSPALTNEQIKKKIAAVIKAAVLAKESGFDGIEIHSIHWGYLLDQFAMSFLTIERMNMTVPLKTGSAPQRKFLTVSKMRAGRIIRSVCVWAFRLLCPVLCMVHWMEKMKSEGR